MHVCFFGTLPYLAKDFAWQASLCYEHFMPYFHVQIAHASSMSSALLAGFTLDRLKNEVVERKHKEAKNLHIAQGAGRGGPSADVRVVNTLTACTFLDCPFYF